MAWARFDDRLQEHPKVREAWRLCPASVGLFVMSVTYANGNLTDGHVPVAWVESQFRRAAQQRTAVAALVDSGLWHEVAGGWEIHDYLDYQPSREAQLAKRQRNAENGRKGGEAKSKRTRTEAPSESLGPRQDVASDLSYPRTRTRSLPDRSPDGEHTASPAGAHEAGGEPPNSAAATTAPDEVRSMLTTAGFDELEIDQADGSILHALGELDLPDDVDWWRFGQEIQRHRESGRLRRTTPAAAIRFVARGAAGPPRINDLPTTRRGESTTAHYVAMADRFATEDPS